MNDHDQLPLGDDVLFVMRAAAGHAAAAGAEFIAPSHLLLALADEPQLRDVMTRHVRREAALEDARLKKLPGIVLVPEPESTADDAAPFQRYDSLAFAAPGGARPMWLDREAFGIFVEGARRVETGPYHAKHLVLGYLAEAVSDPDLQALIDDGRALAKAVAGRG